MGRSRMKVILFSIMFLTISACGQPRTIMYSQKEITTMPPGNAAAHQVIGYFAEWDQQRGFQTIQDHVRVFTSISPFWYRLDASGNIVHYINDSYEDPRILTFLRANNIQIIPVIANVYEGTWNDEVVRDILNDPQRRDAHVKAIVDLVVSRQYDGIDIDYENLRGSDRDVVSQFLTQLSDALHAQNKLLTVDVFAKTYEPGESSSARAQDWHIIGQVADQVRIMIYNYHWMSSAPGPIAPITWADQVAAFATSLIPREKIILGFGLYGIDWIGKSGNEFQWQELTDLATLHKESIQWDETSMSPWFQYTDKQGEEHTVWFENAASVSAKLDLVTKYQVAGVHFWRLGGEDPQTWDMVRSKIKIAVPPVTRTSEHYVPMIQKLAPACPIVLEAEQGMDKH